MKFKIKVRNKNTGNEWWEEYNENITDTEQWAKDTMNKFNRTLHPHEALRELLQVETLVEGNERFHDWVKRTDGMSVPFRGQVVDLVFCKKCEITGKRYGLAQEVKIDSKFRKKAYQECHTSQEERRNHDRINQD